MEILTIALVVWAVLVFKNAITFIILASLALFATLFVALIVFEAAGALGLCSLLFAGVMACLTYKDEFDQKDV
jgi:hypothetical protein